MMKPLNKSSVLILFKQYKMISIFAFAFSLLSADPCLGKVDKFSLSQQTLMELFIEGISNKERVCGNREHPKDISKWDCVTFDEDKGVLIILWVRLGLAGRVNFKWLPFTVYYLSLSRNALFGPIDLTCLPEEMKDVYLSRNEFTGDIDLTELPKSIERLDVSVNKFTGRVDLTRLPVRIIGLFLNDNNFSGETDFSQLPESLTYLNVMSTNISGYLYVDEGKHFNVNNSNVKFVDVRE